MKEQSPQAKIIVIGNKEDIAEGKLPKTENNIKKRFEASEFFTTSAKTGAKVESAFVQMGQLILGEK